MEKDPNLSNQKNPQNFDEINDKNFFDNQDIDLKQFIKVIFRRKKIILITSLFCFAIGSINTLNKRINSPLYKGSFTMLISDPISTGFNKNIKNENQEIFQSVAINQTNNNIPTLIEILKSSAILKPIAEEFNLNVLSLKNRIKIRQPARKNNVNMWKGPDGIIIVDLKSYKPKKDIELLRAISRNYLASALEQRQKRLSDGLQFLDRQQPMLKLKASELQSQLVDFREKNNLLEPMIEGANIKSNLDSIDNRIYLLKSKLNKLEKVLKGVKDNSLSVSGFQEAIGAELEGESIRITNLDNNLINQILLVESELAKARSKYTESSNVVMGLQKRLKKLKPLLIKNQIEAVNIAQKLNLDNLKELQERKLNLKVSFERQPELIKEYNDIQQKLDMANKNLFGLVSARESFQLQMAQSSVPWRIIEEPVMFQKPISPNLRKSFLKYLLYSSAIGLILGFVRDRFDYVFHNSSEVISDLKLPNMGNMPYVEKLKDLSNQNENIFNILEDKELKKTESYNFFFYKESIRNICTSIRFLNAEKDNKIILVTSSIPAEGKSLLNILISKTFGEQEKKVLLLDLDLRRPSLHKRLGTDNLIGMSNFLIDDKCTLKDIIQNPFSDPRFSFISAGIIPPDPVTLLGSKKMKNFINTIQNDYDYIILDSPPLMGLSDSLILSEYADIKLLVVSINKVNRSLPIEILKKIKISNIIFNGFISNNVIKPKLQNSSLYGYGDYGYGSNYEYGTYQTYSKYSKEIIEESENIGQENNFTSQEKFLNSIRYYFKKLFNWLDS